MAAPLSECLFLPSSCPLTTSDSLGLQAWAAPLSGGRVAVALWNRGAVAGDILCRFVNVQLDPSAVVGVWDVWAGQALPDATGQINATVAPHEAKLYILTPKTNSSAWPVVPSPIQVSNFVVPPSNSTSDISSDIPGGAPMWSDEHWAARWRGHGIRYPASRKAREQQLLQEGPRDDAKVGNGAQPGRWKRRSTYKGRALESI